MITGKKGFSLIELMITMLMTGMILAAASSSFVGLLRQSSTQTRIVESNVNLVGLEILRRDIETAGYGLSWDDPSAVNYTEVATNPFSTNDAPSGGVRPIAGQDFVTTYANPNDIFNGSDYLVIKSLTVASNDVSQRWSYILSSNVVPQWTSNHAADNFSAGDRVIVLDPKNKNTKPLVTGVTGAFFTTYSTGGSLADSTFAPPDVYDTYLVYGISTNNPRAPFNRADYYISRPPSMPDRCAPNTGILYKATMNHSDGLLNSQPVVDCVADFQVVFGLDNDSDGDFQPGSGADGYSTSLLGLSAAQVRKQVKEVRVYILSHEGGRDPDYVHPQNPILNGMSTTLGRDVNLGFNLNYRWKVYQLAVKTFNLLN